MIVKQVLPPMEEDGEKALLDAIDSGLSNRYKVLEGDFDTLYVMDRESRQEFEVKVRELL